MNTQNIHKGENLKDKTKTKKLFKQNKAFIFVIY